jgi:hypothetical protein
MSGVRNPFLLPRIAVIGSYLDHWAGDWVSNLAAFEIWLFRDGVVVDRGHAANVLDGPLSALRDQIRRWQPATSSPRAPWPAPFRLCPARAGARRFTASRSAAGNC